MSIDHSESSRLSPKEVTREEALVETQCELDDLMCGIDLAENHQAFLEQHDYFGLPSGTEAQRSRLSERLKQLAKELDKPVHDLPSSFIKAKLSKSEHESVIDASTTSFSSLFDQLKTKQISNRDLYPVSTSWTV